MGDEHNERQYLQNGRQYGGPPKEAVEYLQVGEGAASLVAISRWKKQH